MNQLEKERNNGLAKVPVNGSTTCSPTFSSRLARIDLHCIIAATDPTLFFASLPLQNWWIAVSRCGEATRRIYSTRDVGVL